MGRFLVVWLLLAGAFSVGIGGGQTVPAGVAAAGGALPAAGQAGGVADPGRLLAAAARVNGLDAADLKPWHLKATFETFDLKGKVKSAGTFEEWWVSATKYKRSYVLPGAAQTDYGTVSGLLRTGSGAELEDLALRVPLDLFQPMPASFENYAFVVHEQALGQTHLRCISTQHLKLDEAFLPFESGMYCLNAELPALRLRVSSDGKDQALYNNLVGFQGKYVAREINLLHDGKPILNIHVGTIESLAPVNDAEFVPPAEARAAAVPMMSEVMGANLFLQVRPNYPILARERHEQGTVVMRVRVGKDGHVAEVHVRSGPPLLIAEARETVQQWVYRPYLLNGVAAEVEFSVRIVYSMGIS